MLKVEQVLAMCDNVNAEVSLIRDNANYARDDARWGARILVERREDGRCDEITVKRSAADGGTALIAAWMAFEKLAGEGLALPMLAGPEEGDGEEFTKHGINTTHTAYKMGYDEGKRASEPDSPDDIPF